MGYNEDSRFLTCKRYYVGLPRTYVLRSRAALHSISTTGMEHETSRDILCPLSKLMEEWLLRADYQGLLLTFRNNVIKWSQTENHQFSFRGST